MRPARSASAIMLTPMRSFTLPRGFWLSSFATTSATAPSVTRFNRTSGVRPINSVTSLAIFMDFFRYGFFDSQALSTALKLYYFTRLWREAQTQSDAFPLKGITRNASRWRGFSGETSARRPSAAVVLLLLDPFRRLRPSALAFTELRSCKRGAAGAASPAGKGAGQQARTVTIRLGLVRAHRQNQLAPTLRTFSFLHSPV